MVRRGSLRGGDRELKAKSRHDFPYPFLFFPNSQTVTSLGVTALIYKFFADYIIIRFDIFFLLKAAMNISRGGQTEDNTIS